jgi:hypothetical protein
VSYIVIEAVGDEFFDFGIVVRVTKLLYGQHRTTSYNDTVFPVESFAIPRSEPQ